MKRLFLAFTASMSFLACGTDPREDTGIINKVPIIGMEASSFKTGPCQSENHPCFEISFNLPELKGGTAENVVHFNSTIDSLAILSLRDFTVDAPVTASKEELIEILFNEYNTFAEGVDDSSGFMNWTISVKADIVYQSNELLSFSLENYSYTGGAHPNTFVMYYNYSFVENKLLELEDIVTNTAEFSRVAESIFRTQFQVAAGQNLSEKGFMFDGDTFKLNQNFAWTGNHLIFRFNPYEIGPYAMGPQEIRIPVEAVKNLLVTRQKQTN